MIECASRSPPTDFYWGNADGTFRLDVLGAGLTVENGWGLAVVATCDGAESALHMVHSVHGVQSELDR